MNPAAACPYGSQLAYQVCCEPYHIGIRTPPDAEALMRSRYSAYVYYLENYLRATCHPDTVPLNCIWARYRDRNG